MDVVMDYKTGKIVSGKIEKPPAEWLAVNVFAPIINMLIDDERRSEKGERDECS